MKLHIFFSPAELASVVAGADDVTSDVYIVVDVIRATTSLSVIFERGAAAVLVADTLEQAEQAAHAVPGRLLCGERNVQPLPGFDYGNSPAHFLRADLRDRELVLTTTNGTRAFFACPEQSVRLAGCFYNAQAVMGFALACARERGCNIGIVCAAENGAFALDDSVCAGYLAIELQRQEPTIQADESVLAAATLFQVYKPPQLTKFCNSAHKVMAAGLREDLDVCMRPNGGRSVPMVVGRDADSGLLRLKQTAL